MPASPLGSAYWLRINTFMSRRIVQAGAATV
jgi:hypothetical protein